MLDFDTTAFVSILFLADPPGNIPPYLALTARYDPARRRKTALTACLVATLTLMAFGAVGTYLFHHLGLTLPAFQIAGGLVLFLVALDMIRARRSTQEGPGELAEGAEADDVAGQRGRFLGAQQGALTQARVAQRVAGQRPVIGRVRRHVSLTMARARGRGQAGGHHLYNGAVGRWGFGAPSRATFAGGRLVGGSAFLSQGGRIVCLRRV